MPRRSVVLGLVLLLSAFSACAAPEYSAEREAHFRLYQGALAPDVAGFVAELSAEVPELLEDYSVPGASIALVVDGRLVWAGGFGWANPRDHRPVLPDTPFAVNSLSKPVAAWGVMRLVEQGWLDLDAPISTYLHGWQLPPSEFDASAVTARRLLSHTAGISSAGFAPHAGSRQTSIEVALNGDVLCDQCAMAELGRLPAAFIERAHGAFGYSHHNYSILQLAIEETSGETFADFMREEVLRPAGMKGADFEVTYDMALAAAVGDEANGSNRIWTDPVQAAVALSASAEDLAMFVAAHLAGPSGERPGRGVLRQDSVVALMAPQPGTEGAWQSGLPNAEAFGLGYRLDRLPSGSPLASSWDSIGGWSSGFAMLPQSADGLVILTNGSITGLDLHRHLACAWLDWLGESGGDLCVAPVNAFVALADGTGAIPLTESPPNAIKVGWSPDGGQVLFETAAGAGEQLGSLFIGRADGSSAERVPFPRDWLRTWYELSPTGDRFAFMGWAAGDGLPHLYTAATDGSDERRLTDSPDVDVAPTWSPDGTRVAFLRGVPPRVPVEATFELRVISAGGGPESVLAEVVVDFGAAIAASFIDWSPDGSEIAFSSQGDIYSVAIGNGSIRRLTTDGQGNRDPNWSPDGERIAFAAQVEGQYDIFVMNADGSEVAALIADPSDDLSPTWSPDGTRLAFLSDRDSSSTTR